MADVLADGRSKLSDVILATDSAGIDVAPAHIDLASTEGELFTALGRESILREALDGQIKGYDYVLIDCPPNLGLLTVNGLVAANGVIIPVQTQYYAMKGLTNLVKVINAIRLKLNRNLRILGLLPTFYDGRTNLARDMLDELRVVGDHHVFSSIVRNTVKLGEAPSSGGRSRRTPAAAKPPGRTVSWHERWWTLARPDFRAAAARRLSEERELSPAIVSLLSPDGPTRSVGVRIVPVDKIEPNPEQPRLAFNQETLDELAASIREHGVLQPILVRPIRPEHLSADRRRAALARLEAGRAGHDPGPDRGDRRRHRARDLDHREPPARGHLATR